MKNILLLLAINALLLSCNSQSGASKNTTSVKIEFRETYAMPDISADWKKAADWVIQNDSVLRERNIPPIDLNGWVKPAPYGIGSVEKGYLSAIDELLNLPEVKKLFPANLKFVWGLKPETEGEALNRYILYAVKTPKDKQERITGKCIESATVETNEYSGSKMITLTMNKKGARLWEKMTKNNIGKPVAITLDDQVLYCPIVNMTITDGITQIDGYFTEAKARDLADRINAGRSY